MTTLAAEPAIIQDSPETMADLLRHLGDISPARVRMHPAPGTATEKDVVRIHGTEKRLFELVDGVLVEKGMGFRESMLAGAILAALRSWVIPRKLGVISGEAGMMKLEPGQVRIPDVAYISRDRFPGGKIPEEPVPLLTPDIAVEVLSESNPKREIARKLSEYFAAGTKLAWIIDAATRTATVYTSPSQFLMLAENQSLDGGTVLPGFTLSLHELFAEIDS